MILSYGRIICKYQHDSPMINNKDSFYPNAATEHPHFFLVTSAFSSQLCERLPGGSWSGGPTWYWMCHMSRDTWHILAGVEHRAPLFLWKLEFDRSLQSLFLYMFLLKRLLGLKMTLNLQIWYYIITWFQRLLFTFVSWSKLRYLSIFSGRCRGPGYTMSYRASWVVHLLHGIWIPWQKKAQTTDSVAH